MKQVRFEKEAGWDTIATAIIDPLGPDGKQWSQAITNYVNGFTNTQQHGFQYSIGKNFPVFFKKKLVPTHKKHFQILTKQNKTPSVLNAQSQDLTPEPRK